jgi:hypothetical protein
LTDINPMTPTPVRLRLAFRSSAFSRHPWFILDGGVQRLSSGRIYGCVVRIARTEHPLAVLRFDGWGTAMAEAAGIPEAYREARRAAYSQSIARLQQGASAAATTLLKTMIDPDTPASVHIRAAECILNHATKAIEIEDIEARVSALEAATTSTEQRR